jgi:phosphotransferase system IIA component
MASTYFISGTVYHVEYPDGADIDLDDVYDDYFNEKELPEGVEVIEAEVTHYWKGDIV